MFSMVIWCYSGQFFEYCCKEFYMKSEKDSGIKNLCESLCLCVFVAENSGINAEIFFRFHIIVLLPTIVLTAGVQKLSGAVFCTAIKDKS